MADLATRCKRAQPSAVPTLLTASALLLLACAGLMQRPADRQQLTATAPITYRIDPNTADAATLCLLPSIGPDTAQHIIRERQTHGPFRSADDMDRAYRVGEKTIDALRPWITLPSEAQ